MLAARSPTVLIGFAVALSALGAPLIWSYWPSEERRAVHEFAEARCLSPNAQGAWDNRISLESGGSVRLESEAGEWSAFDLTFSDDGYRRRPASRWENSRPHEVRVSPVGDKLWLVVSGGWGDGMFEQTRLYEYDLRSRTLLFEHDVALDELPQRCGPDQR